MLHSVVDQVLDQLKLFWYNLKNLETRDKNLSFVCQSNLRWWKTLWTTLQHWFCHSNLEGTLSNLF